MTTGYLPSIYVRFRDQFPELAERVDALGSASDDAGPLDERTRRLVKLGIAVGASAKGDVRSNVRKALEAGAVDADIYHVIALSVSSCGLPAAVAALSWVDEVLVANH